MKIRVKATIIDWDKVDAGDDSHYVFTLRVENNHSPEFDYVIMLSKEWYVPGDSLWLTVNIAYLKKSEDDDAFKIFGTGILTRV